MCAEGGTGYYHSVTMGRSKNIWGPYEPDPCNPILTSNPVNVNERADWDHLKPRYYNPDVKLQKAGHASYVDLPNGETWMVFHTSRPFTPELRCTQNGVKREYHDTSSIRTFVEDGKDIYLRVRIRGRDVQFSWSVDGEDYADIGPVFDISRLSDEYSEYGEFTGTFVGITCGDRMMHRHTADFDFFDYQADEHADVK